MRNKTDNVPAAATEILEELKHKKVAELLVADVSPTAIAKELGISRRQVNKIMAQDEFKAYLREMADQMVSTAANTWRAAMQERVSSAMKVLDFHLKQNNLEAVKIIIKSIGLEKQEVAQQSSNLTVVLPDFNATKTIEVDNGTDA